MKHIILFFTIALFSFTTQAKLNVMATTSDVGALVQLVGKDKVEVFSVAKGTQDPHHIEARPSFMVKFNRADLVVSQGLELENAWLIPLLEGARNPSILRGTEGFLELGQDLDPLEIPLHNVSRIEGDVHPGGNPHFQLDPIRMGKAAIIIADRLSSLEPGYASFFKKNAKEAKKHLKTMTAQWQQRIAKTGIKQIVTYHKTLTYFCDRFGIKCDIQLEPKPGIPPTTSHLLSVINKMKKRNVHHILIENYFDDDVVDKIKSSVPNVYAEKIPVSVGGERNINTLDQLYERLVTVFEKAKK